MAVLMAVTAAIVFTGCRAASGNVSSAASLEVSEAAEIRISIAEWAETEWEDFSCDYFTMSVPKGWRVTWGYENDILEWSVSRPNSISCVSYLEQDTAANSADEMASYKTRSFMEKGSAEEYFENLYNTMYELKYPATGSFFRAVETVHLSDNEKVCAEFPNGKLRDRSSVYGEFSENDVLGEGTYSAAVFNTDSKLWTVRHIIFERAPKGELKNWQPVYEKIISSFAYTGEVTFSDGEPADVGDTSPLKAAMNARKLTDVIQQEKHSDIVGGYERIYDTETKAIYRAYTGFLDEQEKGQNRYTAITDSQYADGYSGWITKQRKTK